MRDHALLNLLNELKKSDKIEACGAFCRLFAMCLINPNNAGTRIVDSIYYMTLKLLKNASFGV